MRTLYSRYVFMDPKPSNALFSLQLCMSPFVKTIKEVEDMDNTPKCEKLRKGRVGFVVPTSYIVMIKQDHGMSEIVSLNTLTHLCHNVHDINMSYIIL